MPKSALATSVAILSTGIADEGAAKANKTNVAMASKSFLIVIPPCLLQVSAQDYDYQSTVTVRSYPIGTSQWLRFKRFLTINRQFLGADAEMTLCWNLR